MWQWMLLRWCKLQMYVFFLIPCDDQIIGDMRAPVLLGTDYITLPAFSFKNPMTLAYWTMFRSTSTAEHYVIRSSVGDTDLLTAGYSDPVNFYFTCVSSSESVTTPYSGIRYEWVHHTILLEFLSASTAAVKYSINGGTANGPASITCNQIVDSTSVYIRLRQPDTFFRDFKAFNYLRTQDEITYGYRNKENPMGEFHFYYDFTDNQGSAILKDRTLRADGNFKVDVDEKHTNSFFWTPLSTVPFICAPGTFYDTVNELCVPQVKPYLNSRASYSVPDLAGSFNTHMVTFWVRTEVASITKNILVITYDGGSYTHIWKISFEGNKVCTTVTTSSSTDPSKCTDPGDIKTGVWYFIGARVYATGSGGYQTYTSLYLNTQSLGWDRKNDNRAPTHTGATVAYGGCTSSCDLYVSELKVYKTYYTTDESLLMYYQGNPFNNEEIIIYYTEFSNIVIGHYLKKTFHTAADTNLPDGLTEIYPNPYKGNHACPLGYFFDYVQCVPTFGHLSMEYPTAQFQTVPIFDRLANSDPWTLEGWVIATKITDSGTFTVFGLGDDECAFLAAYCTSSPPAVYALKQKLGGTIIPTPTLSAVSPKQNYWHYVALTMGEYGTPDNFQLYVKGGSSATAKIGTNWVTSYSDSKLRYIMIGGTLGESIDTVHRSLKVKNLKLWKGAFSTSKLVSLNQKGFDLAWNIPELLDYYDFSYDFDAMVTAYHFPAVSQYKLKAVHYYSDAAPSDYYEKQAAFEPILPYLGLYTASLYDIHQCPPNYNKQNGLCRKDEGAINAVSPELNKAQIILNMTGIETSPDWTIEFWIKVRSMSGTNIPILVQETLDTAGLAIKRNTNINELLVYPMEPTVSINIKKSCGFKLATWLHIAIQNSKEGDYFKVSLEPPGTDEECPTTGFNLPAAKKIDSAYPFVLGDTAGGFDGKIKEFRLWNTVRSREFDIAIYKYSALDRDTFSQFVLYYPINEGEGTAIFDKVGGLTGVIEVLSGAKIDDVWTKDYDLPICYPTHTFEETWLSCRRTYRKQLMSGSVDYKVYFTTNTNPVDAITFSFWIKPTVTVADNVLIQSTNAIEFSITNSKYVCKINMKPSGVSASLEFSTYVPDSTKWAYVGCAWKSFGSKIRGNVDQDVTEATVASASGETLINWVAPETVNFLNNFGHLIKRFRIYSYYQTNEQVLLDQYAAPDLYNPYIVLYTMIDDSYKKVYDPSNRLFDLTASPAFNKVDDPDLSLMANDGGFKIGSQVIKGGILTFTSRSTTTLSLLVGYKSFYLMAHNGFYIRLQARITPPLTGKVTFFDNQNVMSCYVTGPSWKVYLEIYNPDADKMEKHVVQSTFPESRWTWLHVKFDPNFPNELIVGIDDVFETLSVKFSEGILLTDSNTLVIDPRGAAETSIREFSLHTVGFTKNEALLSMNRRIDPARDIAFLLSYYKLNEAMSDKIYDSVVGYYPTLLWDAESEVAKSVPITVSLEDGPKWTVDKDAYRFCKPFQFLNKGVCVSTDKVLWFVKDTTKSVILPKVKFPKDYTIEFWLFSKYDIGVPHTEQLFIRSPSNTAKISLIIGTSATIRCYISGEGSTVVSEDSRPYLEYSGITSGEIRQKWVHISCANAISAFSMSGLRFNGKTSASSVAKGFPVEGDLEDSLVIGKNGQDGFTGAMRELRVWNYFIPAGTTAILMRKEIRPLLYSTTLLGYWKLHESAGATLYDVSTKSQTAELPLSNATGSAPEWTEIWSVPNGKLRLAGPSEMLERHNDPSYLGSVAIDKAMCAIAPLGTTVGPEALDFPYTEDLSEFTVRLWVKIDSLVGYFKIYKDKHFTINLSRDATYPQPLVSYFVGTSNMQLNVSKNVDFGVWSRVHLALSSVELRAFAYFVTTASTYTHLLDQTNDMFKVESSTDPKIYFTYTDSDIYLKSIEIRKSFIAYTPPVFPTEPINILPITTDDVVYYVKFGEVYAGKMYDHSIYGKEFDVTLTDPAFGYQEMQAVCSPTINSITVDSSATIITIKFDKEIIAPKASEIDPTARCLLLFTTATLKELGTDPQCEIVGKKIELTVGDKPTFLADTKVTLRQDIIYTEDCMFPLRGRTVPISKFAEEVAANYYPTLLVPSFTVTPTITLAGPSEHSMCENLTLSIPSYSGLAKRSISYFSVSCISSNCGQINLYLSQSLSTNSITRTITIPSHLLDSSTNYTFKATLANFMDSAGMTTLNVTTLPETAATVTVEGAISKWKRHLDLSLKATAIAHMCNTTVLAEGCEEFNFEFVQTEPQAVALPITRMIRDGCSGLTILADTLEWNTDYWLIARATSKTNPAYSGYTKFLIRAELIPPLAYVKGSDQTVGYAQGFYLEGSYLEEPDSSQALSYQWKCYNHRDNSKCRYSEGNEVYILPSKNVTFPPYSFPIGAVMDFCFQITSTANSVRVDGAPVCQQVTIVASSTTLQPQIRASKARVNLNEKLLLGCYVKNVPADDEVVYKWETPSHYLLGSSYVNIQDGISVVNSAYLKVDPHVLVEWWAYTFTCLVTLKSKEKWERTSFTPVINRSPVGGKLQVWPLVGCELNTTFILKGADWSDPDDGYPLKYSFYYKVGDKDYVPIRERMHSDNVAVLLPAGDPFNNYDLTILLIVTDTNGGIANVTRQIKVTSLGTKQRENKLKEMLQNTTVSGSANFMQVMGMILDHTSSSSGSSAKMEFHTALLDKLQGLSINDTTPDALQFSVIDLIKDTVALPTLSGKYVASSLEIIWNLMQHEKRVVQSVYPSEDYLNNSLIDYGLPQEYINKVASTTSNILSNLTSSRNSSYTTPYDHDMSNKVSTIISNLGLSLLKDQLPANTTRSLYTENFNITALRADLNTTKALQFQASNAKLAFSPEGLQAKDLMNSSYDIILADIAPTLYPLNNQTIKSRIVRLVVYNASENRSGSTLSPVKIRECAPISLGYSQVTLTGSRVMPACSYYSPAKNRYITNDPGVTMRKYSQVTKEVECVLTHLTDFAILETTQVNSRLNYYILCVLLVSGILLHLWAFFTAKSAYYDYPLQYKDKSTNDTLSKLHSLPEKDESAPANPLEFKIINPKEGLSLVEDRSHKRPFCSYSCGAILWYSYICVHPIWKILTVHSQLYSRHAFALLYLARYTLLMGSASVLFRYDLVMLKNWFEKGLTLVVLVLAVSIVCMTLKLMCRNTVSNIKAIADNKNGKSEGIAYFEQSYFSWKVAIAYGVVVSIAASAVATVIFNEYVTPYTVSFKLTELYVFAVLYDVVFHQALISIIQFYLVMLVYRRKTCECFEMFICDEIVEELGLFEAEVIPTAQFSIQQDYYSLLLLFQ
eukprot:TRINITY_DN255_c0_g2_i1.p1 TRINITY_DN255_c0_g2~~TRINITY_DN255_c0_g2_i1.p1  ORF type:complete len:3304 (-),score=130.69 TRINITY_DN255_c0_g2_i1:8396-18307(-)